MSSRTKVAAPPTLREISKPRIGIAGSGGGLFCIFHQAVHEKFLEHGLMDHVTALYGTSGSAVQNAITGSALAQGNPNLIMENGRGFWSANHNSRTNPWMMSSHTADFFTAASQGMPNAGPLITLKRHLGNAIGHEDHLVSGKAPRLRTGATKFNLDDTIDYEHYTGEDMTVDHIMRSSAVKGFGQYQGYNDEAYLFNCNLDYVLDDDLTDLIFVGLNPYDPDIPVGKQIELRDTIRPEDEELVLSQPWKELELLRDIQKKVKIHAINLDWDDNWILADKFRAGPRQLVTIFERGHKNTEDAFERIVPNLGKAHTFAPAHLAGADNMAELAA